MSKRNALLLQSGVTVTLGLTQWTRKPLSTGPAISLLGAYQGVGNEKDVMM